MKPLLLEATLVLVAGGVFALAANHFSPRGLNLSRDCFPTKAQPAVAQPTAVFTTPTNIAASGYGAPAAVVERLRQRGLNPLDHDLVVQLHRDPGYALGQIIFLDVHDDDHYQSGHVPGAYQFDYYRIEKHLPAVLPACFAATKIVVYCGGGECEDSELGAMALNQAGVPMTKLFVYPGGIAQWSSNALPVETGERNSGQIKTSRP